MSVERHASSSGAIDADDVSFRIELSHDGALVARVTNRWRFRRTGGQLAALGGGRSPRAPAHGTAIPPWEMPSVDAGRMKTMAALLRDPYPVHWDRAATEAGARWSRDQPRPAEPELCGEHADGVVRAGLDTAAHRLVRPPVWTATRWWPVGACARSSMVSVTATCGSPGGERVVTGTAECSEP